MVDVRRADVPFDFWSACQRAAVSAALSTAMHGSAMTCPENEA